MTPSSSSLWLWFATPNGSPTIPRARRLQRRRRDRRPGEAVSCAVSQSPPSIDEGATPATRGAGRSAAAQSAPCGTGAAVDVCKRALSKYEALSQLPRPTICGAPRRQGGAGSRAWFEECTGVLQRASVALGVDRCAVPTAVLVEPGPAPRTRYGSDRPVRGGPSGPPCSDDRPTESTRAGRRRGSGPPGTSRLPYSSVSAPAVRRAAFTRKSLDWRDSALQAAEAGISCFGCGKSSFRCRD